MGPTQYAALGIIAIAVYGIVRGLDVRLVLFLAALALGGVAGDITPVMQKFLDTFSDEKFVLPICSAMGFAYVIRHCGCDQHLVRLLMAPVRRMRSLVVPGVILTAFVVNIPVISQTSTAVCVGPVAIPLLRAAGFSPVAAAATLCLGASMGGELLNPGAPELLTVSALTGMKTTDQARGTIPPVLAVYVTVAVLVFWVMNRRPVITDAPETDLRSVANPEPINLLMALVPMIPLIFLFLTGPPWFVIPFPKHYLTPTESKFDARLIAVAMLIGVAAAALVTPRKAKDSMKQFFEGAGYGFGTVVSLIVVANCFGEALKHVGLAQVLGSVIAASPGLLVPLSAIGPWAFAMMCGSGMASTQSLYGFFHAPAVELGQDPNALGAIVSLAAAAGRTMSPVAAVVLMCGTITGATPFAIIRKLALPLVSGLLAVVVLRMAGVI
ncbi:anaerobic C4-dicarboxylate transporter DcuC [soil metagenome]